MNADKKQMNADQIPARQRRAIEIGGTADVSAQVRRDASAFIDSYLRSSADSFLPS
jgi:hypothetical protein